MDRKTSIMAIIIIVITFILAIAATYAAGKDAGRISTVMEAQLVEVTDDGYRIAFGKEVHYYVD